MSFTSEISDFASRIRVAQAAKDLTVNVRLTKLNMHVSSLFYRHGIIQSFFIVDSKHLILRLKYHHNRPLVRRIKVISTPGRRVFWNLVQLARINNKNALNVLYILSTPLGLRTSNECLLAQGVGGEVLFQIDFNA